MAPNKTCTAGLTLVDRPLGGAGEERQKTTSKGVGRGGCGKEMVATLDW